MFFYIVAVAFNVLVVSCLFGWVFRSDSHSRWWGLRIVLCVL